MCTAISLNNLFGRNLDLEYSYNESVIITPKNYECIFNDKRVVDKRYALIGTGIIENNYPLYYEACNEYGVAGAGLNFPYKDLYAEKSFSNKINIAPYEILTLILRTCKSIAEIKLLLSNAVFINKDFNDKLKSSTLHYFFSDGKSSITVESKNGIIEVFDNNYNLLTNAPTFIEQIKNCNKYDNLNNMELNENLNSKGSGAVGLPGDFTSMSRFVKTNFLLNNSVSEKGNDISQFFHMLDAVAVPKGAVLLDNDKYFFTRYSCCIDVKEKIYYYKTYNNNRLNAVELMNIESEKLLVFEMKNNNEIHFLN